MYQNLLPLVVLIATVSGLAPSGKFTLSGYFCASCPQNTDPTSLIANINDNYDRINIAFLGWTNNGTVLNQFNDNDTNFVLFF